MSASNQYWTGNGAIWLDDSEFDKVKKFNLKGTFEWEDVPNGMTTERVLLGASYEGSLSYRKTDKNCNIVMNSVFEKYSKGDVADISIIGKAYNKATGKTQRIKASGITFDELPIQDWEEKSVVEVELAFKASVVEILQ